MQRHKAEGTEAVYVINYDWLDGLSPSTTKHDFPVAVTFSRENPSVAASPAPPPLHHFPPCSPPRSNTPESMLDMEDDPERTAEGSILAALSRSLTPSVHEEGVLGEVEEQEPIPEESRPSTGTARGGVAKVEESSMESKTVSSGISDPALPAAPAPVHVIQAINIPTGGEMEEEEEEEVDQALKGDRGAGDQVDQWLTCLSKLFCLQSMINPLRLTSEK
ncbi:hypothetical protein ACOMHN_058974 [Nucella lapillus]